MEISSNRQKRTLRVASLKSKAAYSLYKVYIKRKCNITQPKSKLNLCYYEKQNYCVSTSLRSTRDQMHHIMVLWMFPIP